MEYKGAGGGALDSQLLSIMLLGSVHAATEFLCCFLFFFCLPYSAHRFVHLSGLRAAAVAAPAAAAPPPLCCTGPGAHYAAVLAFNLHAARSVCMTVGTHGGLANVNQRSLSGIATRPRRPTPAPLASRQSRCDWQTGKQQASARYTYLVIRPSGARSWIVIS